METKANGQAPVDVLAMVLADVVHTDRMTGKNTIIGTYSAICPKSFPCRHAQMVVYLALAGGEGQTPLRIRLIDAKESRGPVFEVEATLNIPSRDQVVEINFTQPDVVFPEPGEYRLQLFGNGQLLRQRRFLVLPAPQGK